MFVTILKSKISLICSFLTYNDLFWVYSKNNKICKSGLDHWFNLSV